MKIIQEYSCFPLYRNFEISGGTFFIYIWCSPKCLHLPSLKTSFSKQISEHILPAKLNYGHQQKIIVYPWGDPNTNNICSVTLSYLHCKNLSIFIKKEFLTQQNQVFALATDVCSLSKQHKTKLLHTFLLPSYRWDLQEPKRQMRASD